MGNFLAVMASPILTQIAAVFLTVIAAVLIVSPLVRRWSKGRRRW